MLSYMIWIKELFYKIFKSNNIIIQHYARIKFYNGINKH